jgi:hypothetical protein
MKVFEFEGDRRRVLIYELLKRWNQDLIIYEKRIPEDLPYFYIERTNVGLLSSAAIKLGALTLEEYSVKRGRRAKERQGRADLWIEYKGYTFDIEAKQDWVALNSSRIAKKVQRLMGAAEQSLEDLKDKADKSVGIVFLVPLLPRAKKPDFEGFSKKILDIGSYKGDFAAIHISEERIWKKQSLVIVMK